MSEIEYIDVPITTDPESLAEGAFAYIQSQIPGWSPNAGNLEVILLESMSRMVADARDVASAVPRSIFRYYGNSLLGIAPVSNQFASVNTTWTAINNAGYTIPAGTQVALKAAGDVLIPFQTAYDIVIAPGATATAAGGVAVVAVLPGETSNGLSGTMTLIDPLDWVSSVVTVGATTGGVSEESDDSYLNNLASQLQLLTPRPILPADFAIMATGVAGVGRALAIDGYEPVAPSSGNERMVCMVLIDSLGEPVSAPIATAVDDLLEAAREVNFIVNGTTPTYNLINVTTTYKALAGQTLATVTASVDAAIRSYLSPANWGLEQDAVGSWTNKSIIRYLELTSLVNSVDGVDYVVSLTFAKNPAALGTADVTMTGIAPLPRPNTISVTGT
jgi:hypothetical protein